MRATVSVGHRSPYLSFSQYHSLNSKLAAFVRYAHCMQASPNYVWHYNASAPPFSCLGTYRFIQVHSQTLGWTVLKLVKCVNYILYCFVGFLPGLQLTSDVQFNMSWLFFWLDDHCVFFIFWHSKCVTLMKIFNVMWKFPIFNMTADIMYAYVIRWCTKGLR